jgi:hypothetical protein
MSSQPPGRPPEGWQSPPQQATEPYAAWGQQPTQQDSRHSGTTGPAATAGMGAASTTAATALSVFMWVILAINGLFLWWLISSVGGIADDCAGMVGSELEARETGQPWVTGSCSSSSWCSGRWST